MLGAQFHACLADGEDFGVRRRIMALRNIIGALENLAFDIVRTVSGGEVRGEDGSSIREPGR